MRPLSQTGAGCSSTFQQSIYQQTTTTTGCGIVYLIKSLTTTTFRVHRQRSAAAAAACAAAAAGPRRPAGATRRARLLPHSHGAGGARGSRNPGRPWTSGPPGTSRHARDRALPLAARLVPVHLRPRHSGYFGEFGIIDRGEMFRQTRQIRSKGRERRVGNAREARDSGRGSIKFCKSDAVSGWTRR